MTPSRPPETDLPSRVARIEAGLEALTADVGQFVAATTNSIRQLGDQSVASSENLSADLRKIASETNASIQALSLRQEEGRRAPWSTLAAWSGVVLVVGGVFGGIIRGDIGANTKRIERLEDARLEDTRDAARESGRRDEAQRWMERDLERLRGGKAP